MIKYITHSEISDPRQHTFTVTGTLANLKRKDAKLEIELRYAKFSTRLTNNTTILIVGTNPTQETIFNAALKGKYIMTEEEFMLMLQKFSAEKMMCEDTLRLYKESLDVVLKNKKVLDDDIPIKPTSRREDTINETITEIQNCIKRQEKLIEELEIPNMEFAFEICNPDDPEAQDADIRDFVSYINGSLYCLDGKVKFFCWSEDRNTNKIYEHPCNINGERIDQRDFFDPKKPSLRIVPEERDKPGSCRLDIREANECYPEEADVWGTYISEDIQLLDSRDNPLASFPYRNDMRKFVEKRFYVFADEDGNFFPCDLSGTLVSLPIKYDINKPSLNILPDNYLKFDFA